MTRWIFLRGLTRERRHWGNFPDEFRAVLGPADIYMLDLPGNGLRNLARSPANISEMVEDCRRQAAARGLAPPFHLLGLSMGGMLAARWAHLHPSEVSGCVLLNTSSGDLSPFYHRLHWRSWPLLLKLCMASGNHGRREQLVWALTSARPLQQEVFRNWLRLRRSHPVSAVNTLRQLLASARFALPPRPQVPMLIAASLGDRLVDPECSRRLAAHWNCRLALHPTAGHDLPLDAGPWVARAVLAWLEDDLARCQIPARKALSL